jgi:sporulation protein YlmC with PRC-barrel domain
MPLDDQSMLVELINKRIIEKRRAELVAEVQEARVEFKRGEVKRGTFEDLMKDLLD